MVDEHELPLRMGLDEAVSGERVADRTERRAREHGRGDRERRRSEADALQQAAPVQDEFFSFLLVHLGGILAHGFVVELHANLLFLFVASNDQRDRNTVAKRCPVISLSYYERQDPRH